MPFQAFESEDFDVGGEGNAYHDADAVNNGEQYRLSEGVDIERVLDSAGVYDVGWLATSEWTETLVKVADAGPYTLSLRVAASNNGNTVHLEFDGQNVTGPIVINSTGGNQTWATQVVTATLPAGLQRMRFVVDASAGGCNFNRITFAKQIVISSSLASSSSVQQSSQSSSAHNASSSNVTTLVLAQSMNANLSIQAFAHKLMIHSNQYPITLQVFDLQGREEWTQTIQHAQVINTSPLSQGLHIARLMGAETSITQVIRVW